jgi:hypothetical protein
MNRVKQPNRKPLMLLRWLPWLLGPVALVLAWALVDNVNDREWFLVGCFGVMLLGVVVQIIGLLWIHRRAKHHLEPEGEVGDRRP